MAQLVKDQSLREVADADDVYERAESNTARAAYFLGALGSGMADPVNVGVSLALAPFSGGTSLANIVFREAIINMSAEVLQAPAVAAWYKTLGLDYGIEDFALNLASAAAIGGAFPIVIRGGAGAVQLTYEQMKKGSEVIFQSGGVKTDLAKTAELELNVIETQAADNPLSDTPQGQLEHEKRDGCRDCCGRNARTASNHGATSGPGQSACDNQ